MLIQQMKKYNEVFQKYQIQLTYMADFEAKNKVINYENQIQLKKLSDSLKTKAEENVKMKNKLQIFNKTKKMLNS